MKMEKTCEWCEYNDSEGTCQFHKLPTDDFAKACDDYSFDKKKYELNTKLRKEKD